MILVVHGAAAHARPVESILEAAGYEVVSASDPSEVMTLAECGRPDLVVVTEREAGRLPNRLVASETPVLVVTVEGGPDGDEKAGGRCTLDKLLQRVTEFVALPADR